jgi:hypothetical protein
MIVKSPPRSLRHPGRALSADSLPSPALTGTGLRRQHCSDVAVAVQAASGHGRPGSSGLEAAQIATSLTN